MTRTLFLCDDVMTGRGVDQILPNPGPPALHEPVMTEATHYVELAERVGDSIPRPVGWEYVWGDALAELRRVEPAARIANLETAVTTDGTPVWKAVNYRMNPANVPVLTAAGFDVCTLANNHVLDWGTTGLCDTLAALSEAGMTICGAGTTAETAWRPAVHPLVDGTRLIVLGCAHGSSGVPAAWAAGADDPGVALLPDLSADTADAVLARVTANRRPGDIAVVSVHWGGNWGFQVPDAQQAFARRLVDGGVTVVHGHSSHHAKGLERYGGGLILYGATF